MRRGPGRPPIGKRAMTDAERQRKRYARIRASKAIKSPKETASEIAALRQELERALAEISRLRKVRDASRNNPETSRR